MLGRFGDPRRRGLDSDGVVELTRLGQRHSQRAASHHNGQAHLTDGAAQGTAPVRWPPPRRGMYPHTIDGNRAKA